MAFRYFSCILVSDLLNFFFCLFVMCHGDKNVISKCSQSLRLLSHLKANVTRTALNNGFHRDLLFRVSTEYVERRPSNRACWMLIKESLPKDIYVDPYQLSDLQLTEMLYLHNESEIDVEKMPDDSNPVIVNIYLNISATKTSESMNFTLPLHFRYQKPDWDSNNAHVSVDNAQVYIRCDEIKLSSECGYDLAKDICKPSQNRKCSWLKLNEVEVISTKSKLHFEIPRGNLNDTLLVTIITCIVITWGSFYIGWYTFQQSDKTKKKLK